MSKIICFALVFFYGIAANTEALQCYECGYLEGIQVPRALRSIMDESCQNGSIPHGRFLSSCNPASNSTMEMMCSKVFLKGLTGHVTSLEVEMNLRECSEFPVGFAEGCMDWSKAELLNSANMPLTYKQMAFRFAENSTIRICNCKEDGCDVEPANCQSNAFECVSTKKCIPLRYRCDGDNDCGSGDISDEQNCDTRTCPSTHFQCSTSKKCIPLRYRCDGDNNCGSGDISDEQNCDTWTCPSAYFQCSTLKKCIPLRYRCDGDNDCGSGDESDEENCATCSESQFACNTTGKCIPNAFVCDRDNDCGDNSDEIGCQ